MVSFWAFWWVVVLLLGRRDETWWPTLRNVGLLTVGVASLAILLRGRGPIFKLGGRAVAIVLYFGFGHSLTGQIARSLGVPTIERQLAQAELALFGDFVTSRLQAFNTPAFVEWLQINYLLFLALPLPLFLVLLAKRRFEEAGEYAALVGLSALVCFAGYILLPATTPALLFERLGAAAPIQFDGPLEGLWLTDDISRFLLAATTNRNDAFPSGHTMVTVLALLAAWRLHRPTFWAILPTGVSIVYATLALRYHFAVDVVVGLMIGLALPWANRRLIEWWQADERPGLPMPSADRSSL